MVFVPIEAPFGYREKKTGLHLFKRVFSRLLAGQPDAKPQILPLLPHHGFLFSNLLPGPLQCLHNFCFRIAVNRFHSGGKLRRMAFIGFLPVYGTDIPESCPLSFGFTPSPPLVILSYISRDNLPCGLIYCLFVIRFSSSFPDPFQNDSGASRERFRNGSGTDLQLVPVFVSNSCPNSYTHSYPHSSTTCPATCPATRPPPGRIGSILSGLPELVRFCITVRLRDCIRGPIRDAYTVASTLLPRFFHVSSIFLPENFGESTCYPPWDPSILRNPALKYPPPFGEIAFHRLVISTARHSSPFFLSKMSLENRYGMAIYIVYLGRFALSVDIGQGVAGNSIFWLAYAENGRFYQFFHIGRFALSKTIFF